MTVMMINNEYTVKMMAKIEAAITIMKIAHVVMKIWKDHAARTTHRHNMSQKSKIITRSIVQKTEDTVDKNDIALTNEDVQKGKRTEFVEKDRKDQAGVNFKL